MLAGGCFWGVQGVFQHVAGVTSAVSSTPAKPAAPPAEPKPKAEKPKAPPAPLSPQLASARISTSSFGPIQVGMTLDQAQAAAGTALDAGAGGSACRAYTPAGGPDGVQVFTAAGTVAGFEVTGGDVSTLSGIKVGDSGDQVRSTYGAAIQSEPSAAGGGETLLDEQVERRVQQFLRARVLAAAAGRGH